MIERIAHIVNRVRISKYITNIVRHISVRNHDQTCKFPSWMTSEHRQFHNLNRSLTYHFNKAGTSLTGKGYISARNIQNTV